MKGKVEVVILELAGHRMVINQIRLFLNFQHFLAGLMSDFLFVDAYRHQSKRI